MATAQLSRKHAITQDRLKEILHYDPETGVFTNRVSRSGVYEGEIAGSKNGKGYWFVCVDGVNIPAHQAAWFYMTGEWPPTLIDHEDQCKTNNVWGNLRLANNAENCRNVRVNKRNKTGVRGVLYRERKGRNPEWWASIRVDRKLIHLGIFRSLADAAAVRREAELKYFGEFAPAEAA